MTNPLGSHFQRPHPYNSPALSRRDLLRSGAQGLGCLAFASLLADQSSGAQASSSVLHFPAKARNVILLYMDGGVSHVDSFDPKPLLQKENGQPFKMQISATQFDKNGSVLASPWKFHSYGQAGLLVSELFPHIGAMADELCVLRGMKTDFSEHSQACYFIHSGSPVAGRPSVGAWASYGLGTENSNLPAYVVVNGGMIPLGGIENYSNGFLPPEHQGSLLDCFSGGEPVNNVTPSDPLAQQRSLLDVVSEADRRFAARARAARAAIESAIRNYETAFAMQTAVPDLADLKGESATVRKMYGVDSSDKFLSQYARQCLLARRLVERGVRFVEVTCVKGLRNVAPWDAHENLKEQHAKCAQVVDQPIAALLKDLKARGLLDTTLVIWAGEFGRTPFAQGTIGRDHNPQGFSIWMAGGGIRGGMVHGSTDEYGYRAIEGVVSIHDLHATILHLLGFDHKRLTFRYSGRDFRLTDVYGEVVEEILL